MLKHAKKSKFFLRKIENFGKNFDFSKEIFKFSKEIFDFYKKIFDFYKENVNFLSYIQQIALS